MMRDDVGKRAGLHLGYLFDTLCRPYYILSSLCLPHLSPTISSLQPNISEMAQPRILPAHIALLCIYADDAFPLPFARVVNHYM
jgi:hypothetical protein